MTGIPERYGPLLAHRRDAVIVADRHTGRVLAANAAACRLYGYRSEEWLELSVAGITADAPNGVAGTRERSSFVPDAWHRRKDGTSIPVDLITGGDCDEAEETWFIIRDVSERYGAVARLSESERQFRAIAEYTYDWESWHGTDGGLIWVNRAVERLTGYTPAECTSMPDYPLPIVAPEDRETVRELLEGAGQGSRGNDVTFCAQRRDGGDVWMAISWQPICDSDGAQMGFRTSIRDISDRRRMEAQLRDYATALEERVEQRARMIRQFEHRRTQVEKLATLGELAAGVAHEINNPLAGIRNTFELIRQGLPEDHEYYDLLTDVDREIERMSSLVHQLYRLYRQQPEPPQPVDVGHLLERVSRLLQHAAATQGVELVVRPAPELPQVALSQNEFTQVISNLALNAIQASSSGQSVEIAAGIEGGELRVAVADQGKGIWPEVLSRIFEPFFTTKHGTREQGMGMGLSVSRSLIEAMGGRIEVESVVGAGSTFTVIMPVE